MRSFLPGTTITTEVLRNAGDAYSVRLRRAARPNFIRPPARFLPVTVGRRVSARTGTSWRPPRATIGRLLGANPRQRQSKSHWRRFPAQPPFDGDSFRWEPFIVGRSANNHRLAQKKWFDRVPSRPRARPAGSYFFLHRTVVWGDFHQPAPQWRLFSHSAFKNVVNLRQDRAIPGFPVTVNPLAFPTPTNKKKKHGLRYSNRGETMGGKSTTAVIA